MPTRPAPQFGPPAPLAAAGPERAAASAGPPGALGPLGSPGPAPVPAWWLGDGAGGTGLAAAREMATGRGVRVAVVEEGLNAGHLALSGVTIASLGAGTGTSLPPPTDHGTAVAALIAGRFPGRPDLAGAAPDAELALAPLALAAAGPGPAAIAAAIRALAGADVANNSWGIPRAFEDNFRDPLWADVGAALAEAATAGRGGRGTVLIFAAGNGRMVVNGENRGDDANFHGLTASRHTIAVGATDDSGGAAFFSTPGANLLLSAPGLGLTSATGTAAGAADLAAVSGTSFAAPLVSGTVALMLEVNPGLGARDVQDILALTARPSAGGGAAANAAKGANGGGLVFDRDIGFGRLDARAAVQLAATWEPRGLPADEVRVSVAAAPRTAADPLNARFDLTVAGPPGGFDLDWVEVTLTLTDARLRDLAIDLRSPAGTVMTVVPNLAAAGNRTWLDATFAVAGLRGEDIAGTWTLSLRHPEATPRLSVYAARLDFYGDPDRADDVHVFTPAYASLARGDAARRVIVNDDGGVDALNFAAATPGITANLATGRGQADGIGFRLSGVFGTVIGSSGGDRIVGGAGDDRLSGGAGEDVIIGGAGNDRMDGGPGADRMTGGPGDDVYLVDHPGDVIVELVGQGRDRVEGAIDIDLARLGRQIEDATLTGTGDLRLTGNALANRLIGNAGANTIRGAGGDDWIDGGGGGDLMIGGAGADTFVFTPPEGPVSAVARIHDFTSGTDRILLRGMDTAAAVLPAGTSPPPDGPAAVISLDAARGLVFLDPDGAGPAGALTLFTLRPGTAITADDFLFG